MKTLVLSLMFILLISSIGFSQAKPGGIARQIALGGSMEGTSLVMNPFIIDDPTWMYINPAYQAKYKDYGLANIAGADGYGYQNSALSIGLNDTWNAGLILSYDPSYVSKISPLIANIQRRGFGMAQYVPPIADAMEAVVSTRCNQITWGFGLMYGWSGNDGSGTLSHNGAAVHDSTNEVSGRVFGLRAGMQYDMGNNSILDFAAAIRLDKAHDKYTNVPPDTAIFNPVAGYTGEYNATATELQFNARWINKVNNKFTFTPYGELALWSSQPTEDTPPSVEPGATLTPATLNSYKLSYLHYALGIGGEYRTQSILLVGGVSYQYTNYKTELTTTTTTLSTASTIETPVKQFPVLNIGGEWAITDWLAGRMGYYRSIMTSSYKYSYNKASIPPGTTDDYVGEQNSITAGSYVGIGGYGADQLVTMGVGLKFGGLAVDATVSESALRSALGLIGNSSLPTFGYMTASYYFGD
ncbi:MAG: hypothetical protein ACHQQQ_04675 [Bacteroidota bacterium]